MRSTTTQKVLASTVNCSIVLMLSVPFYVMWPEHWRSLSVALCLGYHLVFRRRCPGTVIARTTFQTKAPASYHALYTCGYATILYWIVVPFELACLLHRGASTLRPLDGEHITGLADEQLHGGLG